MPDPVALSQKIRVAFAPCCLGRWPTPLERASALGAAVGVAELHVKREDRSAPASYGGSKVRGLEFLLAGVPAGRVVLTAGGVGSTHCLATAVHGGAAGYRVVLAQFPQPDSLTGRAIATASARTADVVVRSHTQVGFPMALLRAWLAARRLGHARWIPGGGAHPRAVIGHLLAGLELATQLLAPPEAIVTPLGSGGTAAGLLLAVQALGWRTNIVAVRVAPILVANRWRVLSPARRAATLLRSLGLSFRIPHCAFRILNGLGPGYGQPSPAGEAALRLAASHGLALDTTYSAKAFAAIEALSGEFRRLVFWHTFAAP